jgi:hypothetical protein
MLFYRSTHMGSASWAYEELSDPVAITVDWFSGVFALVDINMSYGHYWVMQAMDNVQPELDNEEYDGEFDV